MHSPTFFTLIIAVMLLAIVTSLGYGLFNLLTSQQSNNKIARALTYRIGLSLLLFVSIILAIAQGWIIPNPPLL